MSSKSDQAAEAEPAKVAPGRLATLLIVGWLVPGAGHLMQARWVRGVVFLALVTFSMAMGVWLDGKLFDLSTGRPLAMLGTFATAGAGVPYLVVRWLLEYQGDIRSATYEYGGAFILTAGLMNLLALLDVADVAAGRKP